MRRAAWREAALALALAAQAADAAAQGARTEKPGAAQGSLEDARTFFEAGVQAYSAGRYGAAVESFTEAYRAAPRPQILFSLAQAERRLYVADKRPDDLRRAIEHFRRYLAEVERGGRRADAVDALAELEVLSAQAQGPAARAAEPVRPKTRLLVASSLKEASIVVDGRPAGELPFLDEVSPGTHRLRISAEGYHDEEREVTVAEGSTVAVDVALRPRSSRVRVEGARGAEVFVDGRQAGVTPLLGLELAAGEHEIVVLRSGHEPFRTRITTGLGGSATVVVRERTSLQRKASYALGIAAGVGALAGGALTWAALSQQSVALDLDRKATQTNLSPQQLDAFHRASQRRDSERTAAYTAYGFAAALGLSALGLYVFDTPSLQKATSVGFTPAVAPGVASLTAAGRF